ncbi:MAG: hypothetical protein J6A15_01505 [Clostridia bacterium]|nr:hypothetical protein [Clostridia bacterium]
MKNSYKFFSRLIVGIALILLAGWLIWTLFNTIVFPKLPLKSGVDYVQDVSGSMSEPDKTYARNAISKAAKENKIAIVLDYQLTTFAITDTYIDKTVGNVVNNVYRNQPYVVYTYFKDTGKLIITTNIDDAANDVVDKQKEGIDNDARVVKEILYYQQNLSRKMGLKNWNFNLNTEYMRNTAIAGAGSIILLILGFGVLPSSEEGLRNPFKRRKSKPAAHSEG